ncbi:DUF1016 N-terminal domain-containing protein [Azohydromonas lata]|uniref:DUF1016 N-terminal domain-containing protein n=1 Tax=Azohydromonas lata TaxID=45677 RepID=A0ABU5I9Z5_9BURK|nr:DUF1016 N-terminal domain-containing protein [Azohydromonas lata]MDZ5455923.1 DUF1016 N-terminal domain-containing protein [Azohydromonas lata]
MPELPAAAGSLNFDALAQAIADTHRELAAQATRAVNLSLTLRNWLIGHHIAEYELAGSDRAVYGDRLVDRLAERLKAFEVPGCDRRNLYRYRTFFQSYPQIVATLSPQFAALLAQVPLMARMAASASVPSTLEEQLFTRLSYSHLALLSELTNLEQRRFYEVEAVRGQWSLRELKRQMASLYWERSGLSTDKATLSQLTQADAQVLTPAQVIRDPYVFEFLGLKPAEVLREADLETALLAGMSDSLFVSRYQVELPAQEEMAAFVERAIRELGS